MATKGVDDLRSVQGIGLTRFSFLFAGVDRGQSRERFLEVCLSLEAAIEPVGCCVGETRSRPVVGMNRVVLFGIGMMMMLEEKEKRVDGNQKFARKKKEKPVQSSQSYPLVTPSTWSRQDN